MKRFLIPIFVCALSFFARTTVFGSCYSYADYVKLYPEVPDDQNAAIVLMKGYAEMRAAMKGTNSPKSYDLPFGRTDIPLGQPLPLKTVEAVKTYLQQNEKALPYLEQSINFQKSHYPAVVAADKDHFDFEKLSPFNPATNNLAQMALIQLSDATRASHLLAIRALWHASHHEEREVTRSLITSFSVARSLEPEPLSVGQDVRTQCLRRAEKAFEQAINRTALSADSLTALQLWIDGAEAREASGTNFARALAGDQIVLCSVLDLPVDEQAITTIVYNGWTREESIAHLQADAKEQDKRLFDETLDQMKTIWKLPYPGRLKFLDLCASNRVTATNQNLVLSSIYIPLTAKLYRSECQSLAYLRLMQIAIALDRYRLAHHGVYPQFVTELSPLFLPIIPQDPYSGKPLQYRKLNGGYVLSSKGKDFKPSPQELDVVETTNISLRVIKAPKLPQLGSSQVQTTSHAE